MDDARLLRKSAKAGKRLVAGKEPGCLFYFIAHTGFVPGRAGTYEVPLHMMDKACKNKKGKYLTAGVAKLQFAPQPGYTGLEPSANDLGLEQLDAASRRIV